MITLRSASLAVLGLILCSSAAERDDPGLVVVVGEPPEGVQFYVPAASSYKFDYDAGRISLWDTVAKDNLILPGVEFTAPGSPGDFDLDVDIDLYDFGVFQVCFTDEGGGPLGAGCDTFDFDSDSDVDISDYGRFESLLTGPPTPPLGDLNADGKVGLNDFAVFSGCLSGPLVVVQGDCDRDGDVDLGDFMSWEGCLSGPSTAAGAPRQERDLDGDNDVDLVDFARFQVLFSGATTTSPECDSADLDDDADVDLGDFGIFQTVFGASQQGPPVAITVFVEGLTVSTALGDAVITVLVDPDGDDVFEPEATQPITVAIIDLSPTSGPMGAEITVALQPALCPIAFDSTTTAEWTGVFDPLSGPPSPGFTTTYGADQVHESGVGSATLIAGDGTTPNPPDPTSVLLPGTFSGTLTFDFSGAMVGKVFGFTPTAAPAVFESIAYLDSSVSSGPPVLDGEPADLPIILFSILPDPVPQQSSLLVAYWAHLAIVARVDENPSTLAYGPASFDVDVVTYDETGAELDRRGEIQLTSVSGDDGDPDYITYHSDLSTPLILVDVAVDPLAYPDVILLRADAGGTSRILLEGQGQ
ncbi:MAG TPA: hypothetical protein VM243_15370 [Phycisphaerae bacterium]|nr:hypothetical protein [Phycisphaerae bacterium]